MRISAILPLVALITSPFASSAQTMAEVLNNKCDVTWIGLDFSEAHFVPAVEFAEVQANVDLALIKWNNLLEQEPAKFDLGAALGSTRTKNNTSFIQAANNGFSENDLLQRTTEPLDPNKIPAMLKRYTTEGEGVGAVFIVESFDKTQVKATFHVTFFNMATKEMIFTERISGKPMGFGMRNYWAGAVSDVLKNIKKSYAQAWYARFK